MVNSENASSPEKGDHISSHFNPAIVAASYFASLCGCLLAVELLHRRTTGVIHIRSWVETLACATALGVMGIWCMHFIGNRAIVLGNGAANIQLVYNPGFSTLSVFLPIFGLSMAFGLAEYPPKSRTVRWTLQSCTGVFSGLSVVGMHYVGNLGISNYKLRYVPRYLVASVIIAIGDCLAVLLLFYSWREKWISDWRKRLLCAVTLAGGVSAMHFTASTDCIYELKHFNGPAAIHSRDVQVIIAGILCGTAAVIVLCVLFFTRHRTRVLKRSSQKVMLACVMLDPEGRVLVTTEGVLPAREITDKYNHRTFDEEFDTAHPVFQWIFRVTRNWAAVTDLIPKMKSHLSAIKAGSEDDSSPVSSKSSAIYEPETYNDYSVVFRERFCTAAASLAASMHIDVDKIGVLYDDIIDTGTLNSDGRSGKRIGLFPFRYQEDIEMQLPHKTFGKGQLLFLTRQLNAENAYNLLNAGFKFASIQHVGRNIAETMQIPTKTLEAHVSDLRRYVENMSSLQKSGTWLSCFTVIPKANSKGFDVAVKKNDQDQLPDTQILPLEPVKWQTDFLERMHDLPTSACLKFLEDRQGVDAHRDFLVHQFALTLERAFSMLRDQLPRPWFENARFYGKPTYAHYSQPLRSRVPATTLYSLVVCADLHTLAEPGDGLARVPLSFFNARQQCYSGSPNHAVMRSNIHDEFGPLLARKLRRAGNARQNKTSIHIPNVGKMRAKSQSRRQSAAQFTIDYWDTDQSSDTHELVDKQNDGDEPDVVPGAARHSYCGGILVNSETVIKNDDKNEFLSESNGSSRDLGIKTNVSSSRGEDTFVDELFTFAREIMTTKAGN